MFKIQTSMTREESQKLEFSGRQSVVVKMSYSIYSTIVEGTAVEGSRMLCLNLGLTISILVLSSLPPSAFHGAAPTGIDGNN